MLRFCRTRCASLKKSAFGTVPGGKVDTAEVIARLQIIEKMVPGIRLFWDVESLHSADKWQERLAEEVLNKDVFYLFWSQNAAQSEWVDWEWHCAYQEKGSTIAIRCRWTRPSHRGNLSHYSLLIDGSYCSESSKLPS